MQPLSYDVKANLTAGLFCLLCLAGRADAKELPPASLDHALKEVPIKTLQRGYLLHKFTITQVVHWYLDRIDKLNPKFRALIAVYKEDALRTAAAEDRAYASHHGLLWGIPIVVKDNTAIAGKVMTDGWAGYAVKGKSFVPVADASVVRNLKTAGAIIIGRSNMPDFAKSDTTVSSSFGRTGNSYDANYSPGGSSGGTAVAVSLNMAVAGQGTDTGNSIRNPSANNGLVGMLPTRGLISTSGIHPGDWLLDNTGPITRTVSDSAIMLQAMASSRIPRAEKGGQSSSQRNFVQALQLGALKGKRLGVPEFVIDGSPIVRKAPKYFNNGTSPETRREFFAALKKLQSLGAIIVLDKHLMPEDFDRVAVTITTAPYRREGIEHFLAQYGPPGMRSIEEYEATTHTHLPIELLTGGIPQKELSADPKAASHYIGARNWLIWLYEETLRRYHLDGLIYPALQVPPNDERKKLPPDYPSDGPYSATNWINRLGVPAIVVPAGRYRNGLPFGIEMSANYWQDAQLLAYAFDFEHAARGRTPPEMAN